MVGARASVWANAIPGTIEAARAATANRFFIIGKILLRAGAKCKNSTIPPIPRFGVYA
jgi:hypothetical protein